MSQDLDARIRARERELYEHYDLNPREHSVPLAGAGVTVRVTEFGPAEAGVPVLLLHGIMSVSAAAAPLLARLRGRRVIAVDWPGHGLSGPATLARGTSIREHATGILRELCAALDVGTADVAGHSMGAQFGLYLALDAPHLVRKLILIGAPGAGFAEVRPVTAMRLMAVPGAGRVLLRVPMSHSAYRRSNARTLGQGVLDRYPAALTEVGHLASRRPGFAPSLSGFFGCQITPARIRDGVAVTHAELARLQVPTMLIWGTRDVFLTPESGAASIAAIPDHTLVTLAGAGHLPWLDDPQACAQAITEFLTTAGTG